MKHRRHDDLLKETFADGDLDALRESTLNRSLAALRIRRRLRMLRNGALVALPVLLLTAVMFWRAPSSPTPSVSAPAVTVATIPVLKIYPAVTAAAVAPVPTISDQELLALFANRSVGLLGKPGQQKLVFFDQPDKSVN
jgi:hypothetical protein